MAESKALWELLRQAADRAVADALETAVDTAPDRALSRVNPLAFAASHEHNDILAGGYKMAHPDAFIEAFLSRGGNILLLW